MRYGLNNNYELSLVRLNALQGLIFFLALVIIVRLFYLQVIRHDYYLAAGLEQRAIVKELSPERGRIYALAGQDSSELYPLTVNNIYYEISVDPAKISRPQNITDILGEVLELDETVKTEILAKIKKEDRRYELIVKEASPEQVERLQKALEELRLDINKNQDTGQEVKNLSELGVNFIKHVLRYYPDGENSAHILGFLGYGPDGYSRAGSYGLEAYFEKELAGDIGSLSGEKDVAGRLLTQDSLRLQTNGADLILTIDKNVQYLACQALARAVPRYQAESGTVIVMESSTGAIRAMCNYPGFDPNKYNEVENSQVYNNNGVYLAYEPGSVMKVIAMAIAIDQGRVSPSTLYNDEGKVRFAGGEVIENADRQAHGWVDMKEVLTSSLNTGIVFATAEINNTIFNDYMEKFGFGKVTGITISQESVGDISALAKKGDIYKATASFGQGITVTPLQMLVAANVIADRGLLVKPYIVLEIRYADGRIEKFEPEVIRQVIEPSTASQVAAMMVNVVDDGHARQAQVPGYYVAGKTGTADVPNPQTKRYDSGKTIHTFVGFAPHENAKFTVITRLDNPQVGRFAESTAVPLFGAIAKSLLEYYQIAPNR